MRTLVRGLTLVSLVMCLAGLAGTSHARAAARQARAPQVTAFYAITRAALEARHPGSTAPAQTSVFPAGTLTVGYYFSFSGAVPGKTKFQITQRGPDGTAKGAVHAIKVAAGLELNYFTHDPAYIPGVYTFELILDGKSAARTTFRVQAGIVIPQFFTISRTAFDNWYKSNRASAPPASADFKSGITDIGYYLSYAGTTPKITNFQIVIYHAAGSVFITGDLHHFSYASGYFSNYFTDDAGFPDDTYTAKLSVNGTVVRTAKFVVG